MEVLELRVCGYPQLFPPKCSCGAHEAWPTSPLPKQVTGYFAIGTNGYFNPMSSVATPERSLSATQLNGTTHLATTHTEQLRHPDFNAAGQPEASSVAAGAHETRTGNRERLTVDGLVIDLSDDDSVSGWVCGLLTSLLTVFATATFLAGTTVATFFRTFDFFFNGFESRRFSRLGAIPVVASTTHSSFRQKFIRSSTAFNSDVITQ